MKEIVILNQNWQLKQDNGKWLDVPHMPMQVQDVLLHYGMIDTPWLPGNAEKYRWIWDSNWTYRNVFTMPSTEKTAFLHLKGLDTCVEVLINDVVCAEACNAFLPLRLALAEHVKSGENTLEIRFESPFRYVERKYPGQSFTQTKEYTYFVRKKYTDFVDHIGPVPYFAQAGIYDDVQLEFLDETEISHLDLRPLLHDSFKRGELLVYADCTSADDCELNIVLKSPKGDIIGTANGSAANELCIPVEHPELWWPRGYGSQPLYTVEATLLKNGVARDSCTKQIGFRQISMETQFHFKINGHKVMLRGGNLTTFDQITKVHNSARMNALLTRAENANYNVMRVWSLGDVYSDELYEQADRRGILLWQDMLHIVNEADEFQNAGRLEAELMVKRLKHHPCVLLWCGGNEHLMFHSLSKKEQDMDGLVYLDKIFREVCARLDPDRYYLIESPSGGSYPNDPQHGNTHGYTNMWYVPGYEDLVFAAEDTRISCPSVKSMERFLGAENVWPEGYTGRVTPESSSPWPDTWTNYTIRAASWEKKLGPVERFYDPVDARTLAYNVSSAHGLYYRETVERCRRGIVGSNGVVQRQCGGYIHWKYNSSWPQIYSAVLDYFLEPFIAYYMIKRVYEPLLLSFDIANHIVLWAVNDTPQTINGRVRILQYDIVKNCIIEEMQECIQLYPGQSRVVTDLDRWGMIWRDCVLFASIEDDNGNVVSRTSSLLQLERKLAFPHAKLSISVEDDTLLISSDTFARSVELSAGDDGKEFGWLFEDNYFDLLPFETKRVKIIEKTGDTVKAQAFYSPHITTVTI